VSALGDDRHPDHADENGGGDDGAGARGSGRPALQSVGIALDIIDALARAPELTLSELARRVGVAKSTAHRTCAVLARRGFVDRTASRGYRLGLRFVEYGHVATESTAVRDQALPLLVELRNAVGETVQVGVPAGADVVYIERVEGQRALRYSTNSRRSPLHRSSAGKVLAAYDPARAAARLRAGLPPSTGYTIVVPELLLAELARVRERGYARSVDETELGMSSLAVPVRESPAGPVVAAISMVGPTGRVVGDHESDHVRILKSGARRLTLAIADGGYTVPESRSH
jgi:IclR family KDG regulon transcriptional repressor